MVTRKSELPQLAGGRRIVSLRPLITYHYTPSAQKCFSLKIEGGEKNEEEGNEELEEAETTRDHAPHRQKQGCMVSR